MTVKKLIAILREYDPDQEVFISYQSGDYWRTQVAQRVTDVDEAALSPSDYHGPETSRVLDECDYAEEPGSGWPVVLSCGRLRK